MALKVKAKVPLRRNVAKVLRLGKKKETSFFVLRSTFRTFAVGNNNSSQKHERTSPEVRM